MDDMAEAARLRAFWSYYLLDDECEPRRLMWAPERDVVVHYMAAASPHDDLRAVTRGGKVILVLDIDNEVWKVRLHPCYRVLPEELVAWNDLEKARRLCEARALHLLRTSPSLRAFPVESLEDMSSWHMWMLEQDPICRRLATWGRAAGEAPAWLLEHQRAHAPVMFVHPGDEYALGIAPGRRRRTPRELFWAQVSHGSIPDPRGGGDASGRGCS